jgi:hypothetical protein
MARDQNSQIKALTNTVNAIDTPRDIHQAAGLKRASARLPGRC